MLLCKEVFSKINQWSFHYIVLKLSHDITAWSEPIHIMFSTSANKQLQTFSISQHDPVGISICAKGVKADCNALLGMATYCKSNSENLMGLSWRKMTQPQLYLTLILCWFTQHRAHVVWQKPWGTPISVYKNRLEDVHHRCNYRMSNIRYQ